MARERSDTLTMDIFPCSSTFEKKNSGGRGTRNESHHFRRKGSTNQNADRPPSDMSAGIVCAFFFHKTHKIHLFVKTHKSLSDSCGMYPI